MGGWMGGWGGWVGPKQIVDLGGWTLRAHTSLLGNAVTELTLAGRAWTVSGVGWQELDMWNAASRQQRTGQCKANPARRCASLPCSWNQAAQQAQRAGT